MNYISEEEGQSGARRAQRSRTEHTGVSLAQMHHSCLRTVVVVRWSVDALNDAGYMHRKTMAFQFQNKNNDKNGAPYTSFEDYLSVFKSKRRQKVRHLTFTGGEGSRTDMKLECSSRVAVVLYLMGGGAWQIRKEMQSISESGITLRTYVGADIPDRLFDENIIYELYTTTVQVIVTHIGRQA